MQIDMACLALLISALSQWTAALDTLRGWPVGTTVMGWCWDRGRGSGRGSWTHQILCDCWLHDINQLFQMDIVTVIFTHG